MVRARDLKLAHRLFVQAYRWRVIEDVPAAAMRRPLRSCRVAVLSSAGLVAPGDAPFDDAVRGGDFSHRVIASDVDVQALEEHHRSDAFDHAGIEADRNLGLPTKSVEITKKRAPELEELNRSERRYTENQKNVNQQARSS